MKHLNNYKIFENMKSKKEIDDICRKYSIWDYTINSDGSIDVDGNVDFYGGERKIENQLTKLPLKFNRVVGSFTCTSNRLISLEGGPNYVGGDFACCFNKLTSLEGCPKYVGRTFQCHVNKLTSLEGFPEYVGGEIYMHITDVIKSNRYDNPINSIVKYFIHREDKNNLIELFNYYDIVQGMNVIYDRLRYFYESIDIEITDKMFLTTYQILAEIESNGYKIIY